jgi:hypothetical protein
VKLTAADVHYAVALARAFYDDHGYWPDEKPGS